MLGCQSPKSSCMKAFISFHMVGFLLVFFLGAPVFAETNPPAGVDPAQTSTDPDYGYSKEKPVKVGDKDPLRGPRAERAYLDALRDEHGKPMQYERIGNFGAGPDGHIIDGYQLVTSTGKKLVIYMDMYHPENDPAKQPAPRGLWKAK